MGHQRQITAFCISDYAVRQSGRRQVIKIASMYLADSISVDAPLNRHLVQSFPFRFIHSAIFKSSVDQSHIGNLARLVGIRGEGILYASEELLQIKWGAPSMRDRAASRVSDETEDLGMHGHTIGGICEISAPCAGHPRGSSPRVER